MDEWEIKYEYNGHRTDYVMADTLTSAIDKHRDQEPLVPSIAYYSIQCVTLEERKAPPCLSTSTHS